jgi:hypothetical protein
MKWMNVVSFSMLMTIAGVNFLYIFIRGMAPGASPLKLPFTRFFVYEPGLGFFWLVGMWVVASILKVCSSFIKDTSTRILLKKISWAALILLLAIEGLIFADFEGII